MNDSLFWNYQDHKNGRMREDIVNFIIFALLTFPSDAFDFDDLIQMFGPLFLDPKRRVRQGVTKVSQ
jgi:hypothetical protein